MSSVNSLILAVPSQEQKKTQPNHIMGYITYYSIFFVVIPYILYLRYGFEDLRYYVPMVDLFANVLATTMPTFENIYNSEPPNILSYLSTNFINLVALTGVAWIGCEQALVQKSIYKGVLISVIMYSITYLIPTQAIPLMLYYYDEIIDEERKKNENYVTDTNILIGVFLIVAFVLLEALFIMLLVGEL
jgi:hypothetical protein